MYIHVQKAIVRAYQIELHSQGGKNMKHIIGYIVAYFAGATVVRWYLTSEDGKEDLAEILEDAGYEYLATEITGGQPLARKLAAYEQQEREARYEARYVIPERDLELERLLDLEEGKMGTFAEDGTYIPADVSVEEREMLMESHRVTEDPDAW